MTVTSGDDERLTPDQVRSVTFPAARLGRRGFDQDHVRAFCAQVEHELLALLGEKAALGEEVARLRRRMLGDPGDGPASRPEDPHVQAVRILSNAQQTADRYVADAQEYSRQLVQDARRRRDEVLADARAKGDRALAEAHRPVGPAATAALPGPRAAANGQGTDPAAELAYLRTFSDVCRTHLRTYLEALLRNVEEWERSERSSLPGARAGLSLTAPAPPAGETRT